MSRVKLFLLLVALSSVYSDSRQNIRQCSNNRAFGSRSYKLFGVRTLYENVRTLPGHQLPDAESRSSPDTTCRPKHLYLLARHGARYPHRGTLKVQRKLLQLARKINGTGRARLCPRDLESLKDWKPWVDKYVNKNQTSYGDSEIRNIARRFAAMLPELFTTLAQSRDYRFRSSDYQRTRASMIVFAREILRRGRNRTETDRLLNEVDFQVPPVDRDDLMRFSKTCRKYATEVFRNSSRNAEFNLFMNGKIPRRIIRSVASRLGIRRRDLSSKLLHDIYFDGCCLQQWVDTHNGPWCFPFSKKDLKALDYASDLKEYGLRTNRNAVTREMSCKLAKDIVDTLKGVADADRSNRNHSLGTFRFGHVTTVMSVAANLQLYDEPSRPLTANDFRSQRNRKFTTSKMIPSAGNLAFVLYKCADEYKVQCFWNEKLLHLPACSANQQSSSLCGLETFLTYYRDFITGSPSECDFEEICENSRSPL